MGHGVTFLFSAFFSLRLAVRRDGYFATKARIPCRLLPIFLSTTKWVGANVAGGYLFSEERLA